MASERHESEHAHDGGVGRRGLLRIGLGGAVLLGAACSGPTRHAALIHAAPRPARPPVPAVPRRPAGAPPAVHKAPASRAWNRPVSHVRDLLPAASARAIALTIDDGPHPLYTPMVLEVLRRHGVKATFSMIGINVQRYPRTARQVAAEGHTICNHSMHHPIPFARQTPASIHAEVADAMNRIWDATRTVPRLFRSPGGDWSPTVYRALASYDLAPLGWDVDPRDWTTPGIPRIEQVLGSGRGGDILLCHDGGGNRIQTIRALNQVIPALLTRKLEFVTF